MAYTKLKRFTAKAGKIGQREVEMATLEWVDWFNHHRLFGAIGNIHPRDETWMVSEVLGTVAELETRQAIYKTLKHMEQDNLVKNRLCLFSVDTR